MALVWLLFRSLLIIALLFTGLLLIVVPRLGLRVLKGTMVHCATILLAMTAVQSFVATAMHFRGRGAVAFWTASALAYLYSERNRSKKRSDHQPMASVERERVDARGAFIRDADEESTV